jgi:riboflavin kinase / FMN adenylyltransferase
LKIFHSISEFSSHKKTIVTIGTFDGVHLGHQKILDRLLSGAKTDDLASVVVTFLQHPRAVLNTNSDIKLLNTNNEKINLLEKKKIDNLIIQPFDNHFSELSGEEFVKNILVDQLHIQKIIIGYDHRFGKNRSSDIHDLIYFGKKYHFDVEQISAKEIDEISVSSTKIRNAILDGNIKLCNDYLGYHYTFSGTVIKGKQLGRTIGFPTANIQIDSSQKIIPKNGVYIIKASFEENTFNGIMNIGVKPTIDGKTFSIEVHLFDFNQDIYHKQIAVSILEFVRDETKFENMEALKYQINKDKEKALLHFKV